MAETDNRKKAGASGAKGSAPTSKSSAKKGGASRSSGMVTATAASRATGSRAGTKKATSASKKPSKSAKASKGQKNERDEAQLEAKQRRKSVFAQQVLPYILVAIVLFLGALFITDAISGVTTPEAHPMGVVGFYICQAFLGCLGFAAYLIPLLMIYLVIFWKRYYEDGVLIFKVVLSVVLMLLISAIVHVFTCQGNPVLANTVHPIELYKQGAVYHGGGIVGGLLGYLMYIGLRLPGTIVLSVLALPLIIMGLVGVTPAVVFGKLWGFIKEAWQKSSEERALRKAEEEAEEAAEEEKRRKAADAEKYRERRARRDSEARRAEESRRGETSEDEDGEDYDEDYDEDAEADDGLDDDGDAINDENLVVNARTGEVVEVRRSGHRESRPGKDARRGDRQDRETDDVAALPFYDTAETQQAAEETASHGAAAQSAHGTRKAKPTRAIKPDRDMEALETMEIDFDDEGEFVDDTDEGYRTAVNYEVVTDNAPEAEAPSRGAKKNDPYATVRILKSETSAVAEAGLSEEEVVISSAHVSETDAAEEEAEEEAPAREYVFPPVDLLTKGSSRYEANEAEIAENTQVLRDVLESFHIRVREISCSCGPTITRFEVKPDSGVRVRSIANLVDDIAMGLAKAGVRIEAPIPGKAAVGIEVPNAEPSTVYFRNILETPEFRNHKSRIASCLGADVSGRPVILDINKMPHLLVAGTTGSGKSVCINSIIMSILYKAKPDEVKLILIDPKKVEFAVYRDLPHLYCPIISDPKKAAGALNSAVNEMERRFELIEEVGVRNLAGYNEVTAGDPARPPMTQMVIIIDELADLMMTASNEVETAICRLAQKARAAGIHLILGTQRPSTDVITGLIKANIPSRIAFTVTQAVDSRIIIDSVGAEKLIGRGDMLYSPVGTTKPLRVQGTFISDSEVERLVTFIKENNEQGHFDESFTRQIEIEAAKCAAGKKKGEQASIDDFDSLGGGQKDNEDPKFWEALDVAAGKDKIGTSALQRALNLGYGRAAKIIDRMEELGFVGPDPGTKQGRKVYITKQQLMEYRANGLPGSGGGGGEDGDEGDFDNL